MKNQTVQNVGKKINLAPIIICSSLFGLLSGLAGALAVRSYFLDPLPADSNIIQNQQNDIKQASSLIKNAKKIINERDSKTGEMANSAQNSLVGVFKKKNTLTTESHDQFKLSDYYRLDENISQGLIITSDGWILTLNFLDEEISQEDMAKYVVITREKKIYQIDGYKKTGFDSYVFLHLSNADNLPVKSFFSPGDLSIGQTLIAVNWGGESYPATVLKKKHNSQTVRSSDFPELNILLSGGLENYFDNAFIFDLENKVVGIFTKKSGLISIDGLQPLITSLLEKKNASRPSLGLTYSDLSEFAIRNTIYEKGALIIEDGKKSAVEPKSAATLAGLREGDIILSINNISLDTDHDLADLIKKYSAGEEIDILYSRNSEEKVIKIKLGELK